jgi:hypothetical protein
MIIKPKTQGEVDRFNDKLDHIRAYYLQGLLTDSEVVDAFKALGYSTQGSAKAWQYLKDTGAEWRADFKARHPFLY